MYISCAIAYHVDESKLLKIEIDLYQVVFRECVVVSFKVEKETMTTKHLTNGKLTTYYTTHSRTD